MTPRRAPRAVLAIALLGTVAACAGDPSDAGTAPSPTTAAPIVARSTTTAATGGSATPNGGVAGPVALALCPTIRAWSDGAVDAVNGFRLASRTLDPPGRKARY